MSTKKPLTSSVLVTLGLTGALSTAVSCGPCLNMIVRDTGSDGDTGDTGDTADDDRPDTQSRKAAADAVLKRGVLPEDVARILSQKRTAE